MWMYRFYKSDSGARKFKKLLNRGDIFKKGTAGYYNCVNDAEKLGIEATGDYVVRYYDSRVKNQKIEDAINAGATIFDDLNSVTYNQNEKTKKKEQKIKSKSTWGGSRPGAGRKGIGDGEKRKKYSIYCSENEFLAIKKLLNEMRATSRPDGED